MLYQRRWEEISSGIKQDCFVSITHSLITLARFHYFTHSWRRDWNWNKIQLPQTQLSINWDKGTRKLQFTMMHSALYNTIYIQIRNQTGYYTSYYCLYWISVFIIESVNILNVEVDYATCIFLMPMSITFIKTQNSKR